MLVVIDTDCIGSCKSNYHTFMTPDGLCANYVAMKPISPPLSLSSWFIVCMFILIKNTSEIRMWTIFNQRFMKAKLIQWWSTTVLDLPLRLCVLKYSAPLARGPIFLPKKIFYDGFLFMWCNFKFAEHVCLIVCVGLPGLPPSGPE